MLNYNKIHSSINSQRTANRGIAEAIGMPESTFRDRLRRENFTPDDIERIADFFGKPITYYFDREESQSKQYAENDRQNAVNEPCPCCAQKEAEISKLTRDLLETKDKYIHLLEKGEIKKEKPSAIAS